MNMVSDFDLRLKNTLEKMEKVAQSTEQFWRSDREKMSLVDSRVLRLVVAVYEYVV
jgi:hypothetical protein